MPAKNPASRCALMSGLAYLVVGVAHNAATFTVYHMGFDKLSAAMSGLAVLLFVATGSSIILAGLLSMYCSVGLKRHEPWARTMAIGAGVYSALLGGHRVIRARAVSHAADDDHLRRQPTISKRALTTRDAPSRRLRSSPWLPPTATSNSPGSSTARPF